MSSRQEEETQWIHEEDYGSFGLFTAIGGLFTILFAIVEGIFTLFDKD